VGSAWVGAGRSGAGSICIQIKYDYGASQSCLGPTARRAIQLFDRGFTMKA